MNLRSTTLEASMLNITPPMASSVVDRRSIGGVMFNMLASSVVDSRFISGVMPNMLASSVRVDRRFIGGVWVSALVSSALDRVFEPRSGHTENYKLVLAKF
jgi:hypothetical protein